MTTTSTTHSASFAPVAVRANERLMAAALAAFLGLGLIFMAGFSPAIALHNAAHDFRHAQNFPCH
ncbi:MAG: CbtB-domain containing protein [Actinomycetospora chiangmaiensis]|nr:CbtB-domain containing protein [Actinomycetospora chiangmaiensis]